MRAHERFLEYVRIETTSDSTSKKNPSTMGQTLLARKLLLELQEMGITEAILDDYGYVYAWIPASVGYENIPPIGWIAHLDTAPAYSGKNVEPILHPNYSGESVLLPNGNLIDADIYVELHKMKGETLITASGGTLLGADDKAGIAEIMAMCQEIMETEKPHGKLCIAFTPDEEIGEGTSHFNIDLFGAKYAYTVDGGDIYNVEDETFNAAEAKVVCQGISVHPGSACDIMVNACKLGLEFQSLLPQNECPENTRDRQGFFHLDEIRGDVSRCELTYILRDHDETAFQRRKELIKDISVAMQKKYGKETIMVSIKDSYYNMGKMIRPHFHLIETARKAIIMVGLTPESPPIRGGTDGSRLSFMGLPCPNLGTGGCYFHGPNECITVERMDKMVQVLLNIISIYAEQRNGCV